jgi:hypothetical protein
MKFDKIKTSTIVITFFLLISMGTSLTLLPNASAHSPAWQIPTYAFISVAPDPAGLGQKVTVGFWLVMPSPTANTIYGDKWGNMTVKVTKPDGTTETLGPFTADATGGSFTTYTPTSIGNYTFQMFFAGQTLVGNNLQPGTSSVYIGDYFLPSSSSVATLTVQQDAIPTLPQNPLPTEYWTRPINSVNAQWSTISGNWLGLGAVYSANTGLYNGNGNYNPYTQAPKTGHILWTKPIGFGGVIGGEFGSTDTSVFMSDSVYEPKFAPIIISGVMYYELYPGSKQNPTGFTAVDLHTGQTLWTNVPPMGNMTTLLLCGQLLNFISPNQYGANAYLWTTGLPAEISTDGIVTATSYGPSSVTYTTRPVTSRDTFTGTTLNMYDAATGTYILSIVNGTSVTPYTPITQDQNGNLIMYYVNSTDNTLNMWNSTQAILYPNGQAAGFSSWLWRPAQNAIIPFSRGIMWSKPLATNISGVALPKALGVQGSYVGSGGIMGGFNNGVLLLTSADIIASGFNTGYQIEAGYSTTTGEQLWITNRTETPFSRLLTGPADNGIYVEVAYATGTAVGYSITSGAKLWTTQLTDSHGNAPNAYNSIGDYWAQTANGVEYITAFGGDIWAVNMTTGAIIWYTNTNTLSGNAGANTPYGVWPIWGFGNPGAIANSMLFLAEGHEYSPPLFQGAHEIAVNITDGTLVWDLLGFNVNGGTAISDGVMVTANAYDNQIYANGMGPTKITVSVPAIGVITAAPVTIAGTITDLSAGASQNGVNANFPNGLPCVSDASMSGFMEAIYEQQPMPSNITGVPIVLSVLDSNGNYRQIGTATSNSLGIWSYTWTPDISGDYTVYATFAGSQSYYASTAATALHASEPAVAPATQPTQAPSAADLYFIPAIIGVIIAIIVVGAVLALLVTKKP